MRGVNNDRHRPFLVSPSFLSSPFSLSFPAQRIHVCSAQEPQCLAQSALLAGDLDNPDLAIIRTYLVSSILIVATRIICVSLIVLQSGQKWCGQAVPHLPQQEASNANSWNSYRQGETVCRVHIVTEYIVQFSTIR